MLMSWKSECRQSISSFTITIFRLMNWWTVSLSHWIHIIQRVVYMIFEFVCERVRDIFGQQPVRFIRETRCNRYDRYLVYFGVFPSLSNFKRFFEWKLKCVIDSCVYETSDRYSIATSSTGINTFVGYNWNPIETSSDLSISYANEKDHLRLEVHEKFIDLNSIPCDLYTFSSISQTNRHITLLQSLSGRFFSRAKETK